MASGLWMGMLVERFDIQQVYGKGYCISKVRSGGSAKIYYKLLS